MTFLCRESGEALKLKENATETVQYLISVSLNCMGDKLHWFLK